MSNLIKIVTATARVACDKTYDYIMYYTTQNTELFQNDNEIKTVDESSENDKSQDDINEEETKELQQKPTTSTNITIHLDDSIDDYNNVLNTSSYTNEKEYKRILPEVGWIAQYSTFYDNPTHIIDNIYLGSALNAATYDTLVQYDIKVIFNITTEISNYFPDEFTYVRYTLYDNNKESILDHAESAYNDIKQHQSTTQGNILVHCYMGKSRSAAIVLYYIMKTLKHEDGKPYTFDEALAFVKEKRPIINPTFRFAKDLARASLKP